jgi:hypothetical protein
MRVWDAVSSPAEPKEKLVALFLTVSLAWAVASMVAILVGQFFPHTKGLAYWEFTGGLFGTEPPAWSPAH